jgi:NAD(P)-dependent dehydrogenase (short-subunit alcohol dehydrogenase family)
MFLATPKAKTPPAGSPGGVPRKWTADSIPDVRGRVVVVTGANAGLGFVTARELARHSAHVVLACRSAEKGAEAVGRIADEVPGARLEVLPLDLSRLDSVRAFASAFAAAHDHLDVLINNAGVMATPRMRTADGFEHQLGTNFLGHFALTGELMPRLLASASPRVVSLTSTFASLGKIDFDDLHQEKRYNRWTAYGRSKLAILQFTYELDRRARAAGASLVSVAAHPGYANTGLQRSGLSDSRLLRLNFAFSNQFFAQSPLMGALPSLAAATVPGLQGGSYVGPGSMYGYRGRPALVTPPRAALDDEAAARLWQTAEALTEVKVSLAGSRA